MKICIAQISPLKGDINSNIESHLSSINHALTLGVDVIIFPELSITGFEPTLAEKLKQKPNSATFDTFQKLADQNNITIGIGLPISSDQGLNISMLVFHSHCARQVYSKTILHEDEYPYFICGQSEPIVEVKGCNLGVGICYETLQRNHFIRAKSKGAELYIASVAKPEKGINNAYAHFEKMAKEFKTPILMANSVGYCDNFLSGGKSAVWNKNGELLASLDSDNTGLLIYDAITETAFMRVC